MSFYVNHPAQLLHPEAIYMPWMLAAALRERGVDPHGLAGETLERFAGAFTQAGLVEAYRCQLDRTVLKEVGDYVLQAYDRLAHLLLNGGEVKHAPKTPETGEAWSNGNAYLVAGATELHRLLDEFDE